MKTDALFFITRNRASLRMCAYKNTLIASGNEFQYLFGYSGRTSGGLFIISFSEHETFETVKQVFDEVGRAVILIALGETLYAVTHILGRYFDIECLAESLDYFVEGTVAEAFAHLQSYAEHRKFGFVHRPVEGAVYLCPVFFRHKAEKIAMLMELHQNVVMGAVDGCSQRLVGQSKCLAAFELAQLDVGDDERFKSIETVWRCRVGNFVNPDDEVAEIHMQVFIMKPFSELLKEFSFGKGEYVHIVAGGLSGST